MRPVALGQITPRRTRTQHLNDAVQVPPVVDTRHASGLVGQKWRGHAPLEVSHVISAHVEPESDNNAQGNPVYACTTSSQCRIWAGKLPLNRLGSLLVHERFTRRSYYSKLIDAAPSQAK